VENRRRRLFDRGKIVRHVSEQHCNTYRLS
jgi:hypothetical protein